MKKILLIIGLIMVCLNTTAQKKYLVLYHTSSYGGRWTLCGEIPDGMQENYSVGGNKEKIVANILNELSERGYEVEFMPDNSNYLLSKKTDSSGSLNAIQRVQTNDEELIEIARYNLQGVPVNENEKGIQIIVYSNYTTKTLIVQ
jgi:hypothetical protein